MRKPTDVTFGMNGFQLSISGSAPLRGILRDDNIELPVGPVDEIVAIAAKRTLTSACVVGGVWSDDIGPGWLPRARAEFSQACDHLSQTGGPWIIWPASDGAVGDLPSLLTFLRSRPQWRFVLDPIGFLTPAMLANVEDHLERLCSVLWGHDQCFAVVSSSVRVVNDRLEHAPLGTHPEFDACLARLCSVGADQQQKPSFQMPRVITVDSRR